MTYNLLEKEWIPVLWSDGEFRRVGIKDALTQAGGIRQIAASNPMDNVALLRFLLAVLQWCKPDVSKEEIAQLLRSETAKGVPDAWLGKLDDNKARFELFANRQRFYQDSQQSEQRPNRPVSDLFAYLPAGTEINHFRHVHDRDIALCPACCAMGLVRLPACATKGGRGLSPSINDAPPIYFMTAGYTLLETLLLNWPAQNSQSDRPAWDSKTGDDKNTKIGVLEGLTWQPRAVWLGPLTEDKCACCGTAGPVVSKLVFKKGRSRKGDRREWRDPYVALLPTGNRSEDGRDRKDRALRGPDPIEYSMQEAGYWRRTARAILESVRAGDEDAAVPGLAWAQTRFRRPSRFRVACFEPFTKQAKKFDEHSDIWDAPDGLVANHRLLDIALQQLQQLDNLDSLCLTKILIRALPRNANKRPEIKAALADTAAGTEHALRQRFEQFVEELAEANGDDAVRACTERWRGDVARILQERLTRACRVIVGGSALDRREAIDSIKRELRSAMEKWRDAAPKQPGPVEEHPRASAEKAR